MSTERLTVTSISKYNNIISIYVRFWVNILHGMYYYCENISEIH
jgi:hypothetical protein